MGVRYLVLVQEGTHLFVPCLSSHGITELKDLRVCDLKLRSLVKVGHYSKDVLFTNKLYDVVRSNHMLDFIRLVFPLVGEGSILVQENFSGGVEKHNTLLACKRLQKYIIVVI